MFKRVDKILIGKDIDRTGSLVLGTDSDNLAEGEIVVLDKDMNILAAGATIADTDTIYIIQGTGELFDYYDKQGNVIDGAATTGVRRFIISAPIEGKNVKKWSGVSYAAKSEQNTDIVLTGMHAVTLGTEYILRIVYKDMPEHPGQFTQTYRHIAVAGDVSAIDTFGAAIAAKVNAHSGRRVQATYTDSGDHLDLDGLPIPGCTTGLTDIDKFSMVEFTPLMLYVDSSGNWQTAATTSTTTTVAEYGQGTWELVRDMEKAAKSYIGFTNRTTFPITEPTTYTVKDETYDLLVIEHDKEYQSPDNQYVKQIPVTTVVAIPNNASGYTANQAEEVLAVLNPWFASCPGAFGSVSI